MNNDKNSIRSLITRNWMFLIWNRIRISNLRVNLVGIFDVLEIVLMDGA